MKSQGLNVYSRDPFAAHKQILKKKLIFAQVIAFIPFIDRVNLFINGALYSAQIESGL